MKHVAVAQFLTVLMLGMPIAQAQLIIDLPDPGQTSGGDSSGTAAPAPVNTAKIFAGSTSISPITRKAGGELYVVRVANPQALTRLDLRVMSHRLKIHKASAVTNSGARYDLNSLNNLAVLEVDSVTSSGDLGLSDSIAKIELQLESYGGNSQLVVTAIGQTAIPELSVTQMQSGVAAPPTASNPTAPSMGSGTGMIDPNFGSGNGNGQCNPAGLCVNDTVLKGMLGFGRITAITFDGRVFVHLDRDYVARESNASELTKVLTCNFDNICNNTRVSYHNGQNGQNIGVVYAVLADGRIFIQDSSTKATISVKSENVALQTSCYGAVCVGERTLFKGNRRNVVDVLELYANGTALIRLISNGGIFYAHATELYK